MSDSFDAYLDPGQREQIASLNSPIAIQRFLDTLPYSTDHFNRCPLSVLRDGKANCCDGALFAAAALRRLGHRPLLINLIPDPEIDDEHILAIYRRHNRFGAVAKSNFVVLRYREGVYRSLRELAMSYFDFFYNVAGVKTLRAYTRPLDLTSLDRWHWMGSDKALPILFQRLDALKTIPLLSNEMVAGLSPMDELCYKAGLLGADAAGLYQPSDYTPPAGSTAGAKQAPGTQFGL